MTDAKLSQSIGQASIMEYSPFSRARAEFQRGLITLEIEPPREVHISLS
jgi:hypothetical protein